MGYTGNPMYNYHTISLFVCPNILPVDMLYFKSIATLMYDINNQSAPLNLLNFFDRVAYALVCIHGQISYKMFKANTTEPLIL